MRRKSPTTIEELADRLNLEPEHVPLLRLALVHRSQGEVAATNNERLEFLGDSVLGMLTNEYLYGKYPKASEGELTRMKANVVNKTSLARAARPLGLGQVLDMARSEEVLGGRDRSSTLADAFEAVLGAIYLSAGLEAARRFVQEYLFPEVDLTRSWDYKSTLQEQLQERFRSAPLYKIISEAGPAHAREFVAEVYLEGELLGTGRGGSKKQAEQVAAAEALMYLTTRPKKTRRTRKTATAEALEAGAVAPAPLPADAAEVPTPLASEAAPEAPTTAAKPARRPRKTSAVTSPAPASAAGLLSQDGGPPSEVDAAAPAAPEVTAEPIQRFRRTRKSTGAAAVAAAEAPAPVIAAPVAQIAPKRGRRSAKPSPAADEIVPVPVPSAAAGTSEPPAETTETRSSPRPRARKRKPDAAAPGAEPAGGGN